MASSVQFFISGGAVGPVIKDAPMPIVGQQVELDGEPYVVSNVVLAYWTEGDRGIEISVHLEPVEVDDDGTLLLGGLVFEPDGQGSEN